MATQSAILRKIRDEFLDLLEKQIVVEKRQHRAFPGTNEGRYKEPDNDTVSRCWAAVEARQLKHYNQRSNPHNTASGSNQSGKLAVFLIFGALLYKEAHCSFPLESVIRILNDQFIKQGNTPKSESELMEIDRLAHNFSDNFFELINHLFDSFK